MLGYDQNFKHPFVKLSFVDIRTGKYIKKNNSK